MSERDRLFRFKTPHKGFGLFCKYDIEKEESVLHFEGNVIPMDIADAKCSLQLSEHFALEMQNTSLENSINHSCDPNCRLDFTTGMPEMKALCHIPANTELSYNYNAVEYNLVDIIMMFHCVCMCKGCWHIVPGFHHVNPARQESLLATASPYVLEKYAKARSKRIL
jgi:hypothetical protein